VDLPIMLHMLHSTVATKSYNATIEAARPRAGAGIR
jgi:hypothetical protein